MLIPFIAGVLLTCIIVGIFHLIVRRRATQEERDNELLNLAREVSNLRYDCDANKRRHDERRVCLGMAPKRMNLFTATDGKEYELDRWYPMPFWIPFHTGGECKDGTCRSRMFPGVPTTSAGDRLVRKYRDGSEKPWVPFVSRQCLEAERLNPSTHWMVKSWSNYEI